MSQYAVHYHAKSQTFTLKDEDPHKPNEKAFSHIYADKIGEMSQGTSHPMPAEHLRNLADGLGLDFTLMNVKNATSNERLDSLNQEAREIEDHEKTVAVYTGSETTQDKDGNDVVLPADVEMRAPSEA